MFEYSQNILNNYDDNNYTSYTAAHPKLKGVLSLTNILNQAMITVFGQLVSNVILFLYLAKLLSKMDNVIFLESYWWKS